jgi:hypothetical protein
MMSHDLDFRSRWRDRTRTLARSLGAAMLAALVGSACATLQAAEAPPPRNVAGMWSYLADWPIMPIHMVMLRDGRVMSYGTNAKGASTGAFIYDIWNPAEGLGGGHLTLPNGTATDIFCSAQIMLPGSGDVVIAGGDVWNGRKISNFGNNESTIFRANAQKLVKGVRMHRERWYATTTTMPDGEVYIQGGDKGIDHPEVRATNGTFRLLSDVDTGYIPWFYPRNWVAPNGRIFGFSEQYMYYVDVKGTGKISHVGSMPGDFGKTSAEAMYAPGKILRVSGGMKNSAASDNAVTIDINGKAPKVETTAPLPLPLHWPTATLLADGKVVVTGGSRVRNQMPGANYSPFIWDPATGKWTTGVATRSGKVRLYHSTAILLPDASVLVGGGGNAGPQHNMNAEIYYPPYLFNAADKFAQRPKITQAPTGLKVGRDFSINVNNGASIARVTLVKTGSVTHSINMDQRFMELKFTRMGNSLRITAPKSNKVATPGFYMLFVIDKAGVPSVAKVLPMFVTPG